MAIENVPPLDDAPVPGPQRGDESTFDDRMDASIRWQETAPPQFRAVAQNVKHNAGEALNSATEAGNQAIAASNYATAAQGSAGDAAGSASDANQSATNAADSAAEAATSAANAGTTITATSATDQTPGTGTFVFVTQAGKQFPVGADVKAVDQTNSGNAIYGTVAAYSGTSLTITGTSFIGTGVVSDWTITLSGQRGAQGPTGSLTGGNLTGALNLKKGADLASAATIDPWSTGGNFGDLTGGETINAFAPAPQPGSQRTYHITGTPTITAGANLKVKGGSVTLLPGDEIDITARTTTEFLIDVRRGAGITATGFRHWRVMRASGNFIPKVTGPHFIMQIGAPGGGGVVGRSFGSCATGAGAGGVSIGIRQLVAGTPYTFNSGSGPSAITYAGAPINGTAGGVTTFVVPGYATMTCNGGGGGNAATVGPVLGGLGGTASGGDINITGGRGGNITGNTTTGLYATGGGAPGIQGIGYNGGDVTTGGTLATPSGGASPGGKGGDAAQGGRGGGAGAGGAGGDALTDSNGAAGVNLDGGATGLATYAQGFVNATGAGAPGVNNDGPSSAVPFFGGASAGHVGSDAARPAFGFAAMGGTASFGLSDIRQPQGPGGGVGGCAGAASGNPTGGAAEGGMLIIGWNN